MYEELMSYRTRFGRWVIQRRNGRYELIFKPKFRWVDGGLTRMASLDELYQELESKSCRSHRLQSLRHD